MVEVSVVTMHQFFLMPDSTVEGYYVLSLKVLCQKQKPQIDGYGIKCTAHIRSW